MWWSYREEELKSITPFRGYNLTNAEAYALKKRNANLTPLDGCNYRAGTYMDNGWRVLVSYDTAVCAFNPVGKFVKLCDGWSRTTMKHVQAFAGAWVPKRFWDELETYTPVSFESLCKGVI